MSASFQNTAKKKRLIFSLISYNIKNFKLDQFLFSQFKGVADKYVRFTQDKLASQDAQISKLKLKRQAMRDQLHKGLKFKKLRQKILYYNLIFFQVNLNLKQKEETGDSLLAVDFQQLQIENAQFLERIDTKNKELINAKMKSGKFRVKNLLNFFLIYEFVFIHQNVFFHLSKKIHFYLSNFVT